MYRQVGVRPWAAKPRNSDSHPEVLKTTVKCSARQSLDETRISERVPGRGSMGLGPTGCLGRPVKQLVQLRLVSKRKTARGLNRARGSGLESRGQTLKVGAHAARRQQRKDSGRRKQPRGD